MARTEVTITRQVTGYAPASISNLGPGFDILGGAVEGALDSVAVKITRARGVVVADPGHPELSSDSSGHTSAIAATEVLRLAHRDDIGLELRVKKGIPLSGGQGGSAASAVAAAVAVNTLLGKPLGEAELLAACLVAEEKVAGRHADNLAASLVGGIVLVRSLEPLDVLRLPVPAELRVVVAHPNQRMNTRQAREVLPLSFSRDTLIWQSAQLAAFVAGMALNDYDLISRSLGDRVAEPYRATLLPGFAAAKAAALQAGALGASISGSGPTSFALVRGETAAGRVALEMKRAFGDAGLQCDTRVSRFCSGAWAE
jgi:homoserine kinase